MEGLQQPLAGSHSLPPPTYPLDELRPAPLPDTAGLTCRTRWCSASANPSDLIPTGAALCPGTSSAMAPATHRRRSSLSPPTSLTAPGDPETEAQAHTARITSTGKGATYVPTSKEIDGFQYDATSGHSEADPEVLGRDMC